MKKIIAILLVCVLACAAAAALGEARFVTIREWLDANGECGDCMLLLKIVQILNPVVALAADETGTVNLYSGGNDPESFVAFFDEEGRLLDGYVLVIANPKYNPYEGTIEMANWTLLRMIPNLEVIETEL